MKISSNFDAGSIEIVSSCDHGDIQLRLRRDNAASFTQWFYFRVQGAAHQRCTFNFLNASESTYPSGWIGYQAVASYDRLYWFRVPTQYQKGILKIDHVPLSGSIYYAYFEPYSYDQHLNFIGQTQDSCLCKVSDLGFTVQQRDLNLLTIGNEVASNIKIWIIARQHPGETMAAWFIEGMTNRLLNRKDTISQALLQRATFYIVPNMNPDGSVLGNLRTNAAGANLNREWASPSAETSPEVLAVRNKIQTTGVDLFLDIHGDENLPYVFLAGAEGVPAWDKRMEFLAEQFRQHLLLANPDYQTEQGYPRKAPGKANMSIATNWICEHFGCLAFTLEMPFKDNANLPDHHFGWSRQRSLKLGEAILSPIYATSQYLRA